MAAQGRGLLLTQGQREKKGWWEQKRWEKLQTILPAWLVERLEVLRRLLEVLTRELDLATTALEKAARSGSCTGLCGGVSASGKTTPLLPITKHGNVRWRTALIELAWRLVLWQRDCKLIQKWRHILGNPKATKAARKKAIVAVARQMAVDLWRGRTGRVKPQDLGWTMLGA